MNDQVYSALVLKAEEHYKNNSSATAMHEAVQHIVQECIKNLANRLIYKRVTERLDRAAWAAVSAIGSPTGLIHPDQIKRIRDAIEAELLDEQYF